jgi:predicted house-cleaning NTP pyrophosphatase (Maf/HAM1 superfamily)
MEFIPVDGFADCANQWSNNAPIEPAPMSALGLHHGFSTRLLGLALILASSSPIRRTMLDAAGVDYVAIAADVDEAAIKASLAEPAEAASALAAEKARAVSEARPADWVIGSDSVVSVGGRTFDKPRDRDQAAEHLRLFSGKPMQLTSAVALARGGVVDWVHVQSATLQVRTLSDAFIVVSAPAAVQRERVLRRPGMTEAKLASILERQMSDEEKRERADFVVDTGGDLSTTERQVRDILACLGLVPGR